MEGLVLLQNFNGKISSSISMRILRNRGTFLFSRKLVISVV